MSQETFTQEQVNEKVKQERGRLESQVSALQEQVDELKQYKPKDKTDEEKALEQKQAELFDKEVSLTLKENGLEKFADVLFVKDSDDLKGKVEKLNDIVKAYKVDASYKPENHKKTDAYSEAKRKGDTKNMIKSLLGFN